MIGGYVVCWNVVGCVDWLDYLGGLINRYWKEKYYSVVFKLSVISAVLILSISTFLNYNN